MSRERFDELLNAHLDGDPSHDDELLKLAGADRDLHAEFQRALQVAEGLDALSHDEPPAVFHAQVMARVEAAHGRGPAWRLRGIFGVPAFRFATAAALALAVLAAGFYLGRVSIPRGPAPVAHAPATGNAAVKFVYYAPAATSVRLVGDFNQWNKDGTPLRKSADGHWTLELDLKPGRYSYLFYVDQSRWVPDPAAAAAEDDGYGRANSVLEI